MTTAELLQKWDTGEIVTTIEMGGMGPGYEQAIHVLVFELLRDHPTANPTEPAEWGDNTVHRVNRDGQSCGFSGAQVGAAKWLAHRFIVKGYDATMAEARAKDPDRTTMVSRTWPRLDLPQPAIK